MSESKERIKDALVYYISTRQFPDVKVSELAMRANVSRSTFYRNFHDIYEVYESLVDDFLAKSSEIAYVALVEQRFTQKEIDYFYKLSVNDKENFTFFTFDKKDEIVFEYIFYSRDFVLIKTLVDKVKLILLNYLRHTGMDEQEALFYARFCTSACVFDVVSKYMLYNRLIMSVVFSVAKVLMGGASQ